MAYVDLDKIINVTGGGGGGTIYPDVPYPVLNQRIGIFNKPNAWDTDSNGWFGLLGNSVAGICQQNYNFNQQMALAVDSGVGALSTRVKSYDFSVDIDKIDGGQVVFGLLSRGTNFFNINETSKKVKDVYTTDVSESLSFGGSTKKSYIVTSGGNRFLLMGGNIFSIDTNNKILSSTPTGTYVGNIVGVVGYKVWTVERHFVSSNAYRIYKRIYTINSNGTITEDYSSYESWLEQGGISFGSYQLDNTISYVIIGTHYNYDYYGGYYSVDLTNTSTFTRTQIWANDNLVFQNNITDLCGYDGTGMLFVRGTDIFRLTASGESASLGTYFGSTNNLMAKYNTLSYYTSKANNICTDNTSFNILGVTVNGDSISTIYDKLTYVYEPTGSLSQDDSFVGIMTNLMAIGETDFLTLSVNAGVTSTLDNHLYNYGYGNKISIGQTTLGTTSVEIQLDYANTLLNDLKLGFGITGGTYDTPRLQSNNGLSGNATTARTAGGDASYIDLTLSTN